VLLVTAALAAAVTLVLVVRADEAPYVAPTPTETAEVVDPAGAAAALQRLAAAVEGRDRDAAVALAGPDDPGAADRLGALVDVADRAEVVDVSLRYVDAVGPVAVDGTWPAVVDVTWAFAGFDRQPTTAEVLVRFRAGAAGVEVAGLGGGDDGGDGELRTPVWMSGPLQVSRSEELLVLVADGLDLDLYARRARAALPTVSRVLTAWRPRLVVEVPADGAGLEAALGAAPGYYAQIAAVTGVGGVDRRGAPFHVFVNPDVFDGLGRAGQQVVLAHEATHVATDAPASEAPTWLVEGFADYVALRGTSLPLTRTAAQAAARVRDDGLPTELPGPADFDTQGPHLGAVYEASWLICTTLADRGGQEALVQLYDAMSAGAALDGELRRRFDWSEQDLVRAWRARLASLPGAS
jgi:hypothetical protein